MRQRWLLTVALGECKISHEIVKSFDKHLSKASINNRTSIASLLIGHGASVNAVGGDLQEIPLQVVVYDVIPQRSNELHSMQWAVRNDDYTSLVKLLLDNGSEVNNKNKRGHDALQVACLNGCVHNAFLL